MLSAIGIGLMIIGGTSIAIGTGAQMESQLEQSNKNKQSVKKAKKNYEKVAEEAGLGSLDDSEIARELYHQGKITEKEYEQISKIIKKYEKADTSWDQFWLTLNNEERAQLEGYYNLLAEEAPELKNTAYRAMENLSEEDRRALFGTPTLEKLENPNYADVNFKGFQREVEPVKLWTGQELADLHNLNFDPSHYYDQIKAGTEADLAAARYMSDQMNNASMINDTENVTSYLDSIRNTKAEALASGATLGQRAANELLANQEALNNYSTSQATVADARFQAVDDALLADASARLTASNYFNQLAKSLATDSMTLYDNDSTRYAQDMLSNAEFYRADQELRGQRILSNANMYADWLQGNAQIANYQSQLDSLSSEYVWLYENALRANDGDVARARADVDNYINYRYTRYQTPQEMYADK